MMIFFRAGPDVTAQLAVTGGNPNDRWRQCHRDSLRNFLMQWRPIALSLFVALSCHQTVWADSDHERVRRALAAGKILPLATVLAKLPDPAAQILEIELEDDDDHVNHKGAKNQLVYEIKYLAVDGTLTKVKIDAVTGTLLSQQKKRAK